jgi:hypothetical protein
MPSTCALLRLRINQTAESHIACLYRLQAGISDVFSQEIYQRILATVVGLKENWALALLPVHVTVHVSQCKATFCM